MVYLFLFEFFLNTGARRSYEENFGTEQQMKFNFFIGVCKNGNLSSPIIAFKYQL